MGASEARSGSDRWSRFRPLVGAIPALLLALVALWEVAAMARAGADVPDDEAWAAAAAEVRARHQPGDLIVFAPRWLDPVGRRHLGDLISVEMAARMDGARYGTIWELSARGARAPETAGLAAESRRTFGELVVRRYVRAPVEVVYDFVARFGEAEVEGLSSRAPQVVLEEVGFEPHRCVRVVPRPDVTVRVRYPNAVLGDRLVGYVGLADVFTRREVRDPGRLEIFIGGQMAARVEFGVDDGWVRFEAPTRATAADAGVEVVFAATAVGPQARDRLICFAAEARR